MPQLGSAEKASVPRVGYLVYRVERRLRARLDEELRAHRRLHARVRDAQPAARARRPVVRPARALGARHPAGDEPGDLRPRAAPARPPPPRPQAPPGAAGVGHAQGTRDPRPAATTRSTGSRRTCSATSRRRRSRWCAARWRRSRIRSRRPTLSPRSSAPLGRDRVDAVSVSDASLFAGLFAHGDAAAAVSDRALVEAMVEFEVALLQALADARPGPRGGGG